MPQPTRKQTTKKKTVKKAVKKTNVDKRLPSKTATKRKYVRKHQEYGTSKLEERFARDFLDKLGVEYEYQFKAVSIGRYYDFFIPSANLIIEVDGDYYHSYGLVYEEMSPMQKRNKRVDEQKDRWALINGIPILRIWEHDINDHPEKVMKMLEHELGVNKEKHEKEINKAKRH